MGVPLTCPDLARPALPQRGPPLSPSALSRCEEASRVAWVLPTMDPTGAPLPARNPRPACSRFTLGETAELWGLPTASVDPVPLPSPIRLPGINPALSPDLPFPRRQGVWASDAPGGLNKTNGQNRTPAFPRRQEGPQRSSEGARMFRGFFWMPKSSQGSGGS